MSAPIPSHVSECYGFPVCAVTQKPVMSAVYDKLSDVGQYTGSTFDCVACLACKASNPSVAVLMRLRPRVLSPLPHVLDWNLQANAHASDWSRLRLSHRVIKRASLPV